MTALAIARAASVSRRRVAGQHTGGRGAHPATRPVAHDSVADLGAGGEADAGRCNPLCRRFGIILPEGLQDEPGGDPLLAPAGHPQEIRPALQARDRNHRGSGGQALAALGTTAGQHGAAPDGRHARAEAVATLADQHTRLIGALHYSTPFDG